MARDAETLGLYGYGSAAHLVAQVARVRGQRVFAFTRAGDVDAQRAARELGAEWAGPSDDLPLRQLDAAIVFAPVGMVVPRALRALAPGGVVVCAGLHMSDIPSFPYSLLWQERQIRSVANVTRADASELLVNEFHAKGGRGVGHFGDKLLLLTTRGAKSGEVRTTPSSTTATGTAT